MLGSGLWDRVFYLVSFIFHLLSFLMPRSDVMRNVQIMEQFVWTTVWTTLEDVQGSRLKSGLEDRNPAFIRFEIRRSL